MSRLVRVVGGGGRPLVVIAAVLGALVIAACGGSSSTTQSSTPSSSPSGTPSTSPSASAGGTPSTSPSASAGGTSSCGPKPGVKATGTPIPVGTIATKESGTDFSDVSNMVAAYFACVNANGGVDGHPLKLYAQFDQTQPAQIEAEAKSLLDNDHVVAMVGSTDLLECTVDQSLWATAGINEIDAGIAPECWSTPHSAPVNMGPRYSSDGAAQYVLSIPGVKKIVFVDSNVPGRTYNADGVSAIAKAHGIPVTSLAENVPITDPNSVALTMADDAGPDGAVVMDFRPPDVLPILEAAQKLGLENKVKAWACSSPCNTDFVAKSLGPKWVGKFFVNSELNPPDDPHPASPQMALYKAIYNQYGKSAVAGGIGSFSEMGFTDAEILVHALDSVHGAYTRAAVNTAIKNIKGFNTGMLCVPWTYGSYSLHIPDYADYTVTPNTHGQLVLKKGCTAISSDDPDMEAYYKVIGFKPTGA